MKLYTKDGQIKSLKNIIIVKDGMQVINPTEEQVLADGCTVYEPEPYIPQPKLEPDAYEMVAAFRTMVQPQILTLSDEEAVKVKVLYDTWASKIGQLLKVDTRLYYNDKLYKVIQQHTAQSDWIPDKEAALYGLISEHAGTLEDPIPYERKMVLEQGKYYTQFDEIYLCITNSIVGYDVDLNDGSLAALLQKVEQ